MATTREELALWVGREILPHERELRTWLRRRVTTASDVDDIVQECYCRLAQLRDVQHIENGRAYLFAMARNMLQQQLKAARVVHLETIAELDAARGSDELSPERIASARFELRRVQSALETLTERARRIFLLRRLDGLSQKEIAALLDVSETVVENDASRSLRKLLHLLTDPEPAAPGIAQEGRARVRSR
ncbi:RNA polymerase sigma factor [Sphingomonas elodea]|uniref:RNA polymerase sigma factor n=1 Tax=Sphingomonas elodea TaxID=179878 RepID=UPI00058E0275|nr:sigma-70 family RNA polymerase sigma factor [Sphingomonas elodea]